MAKFIKEFKTKTKPQYNSYLKKVKDDVINSAMSLLKGREMVFKAFESGIFSKLKESEQSEQSSDDVSLENISSELNDADSTDR